MENQTVNYRATRVACYIGYITQAIVNNVAPLLFLIFQDRFGMPLSKITLLVTVNFLLQLVIDAVAPKFVDRLGSRRPVVAAHLFSAIGVAGIGLFPVILPDPFWGLIVSVVFYALGGGLIEVLVSPIIEACPSDNKAAGMSLLHSFYCWGTVGVVLFSTGALALLGKDKYWLLAVLLALIPAFNAIVFARVPIITPPKDEKDGSLRTLFSRKSFLLLMCLMLTAGAAEQAVAQWASAFAESGLGVDKVIGDIAGPCLFSALMGVARVFFAKFAGKIRLERYIAGCAAVCVLSYLLMTLAPSPILSFVGFGICGLACGIFWPGITSLSAERFPRAGVTAFAMLALFGDLGCSVGPSVVGFVSDRFGEDLKTGILAAILFPLVLTVGVLILYFNKKRKDRCIRPESD